MDEEHTMEYECIGICEPDPLSGRCQGCGRPLIEPGRVDDGALRPPAEESASCG
ncbi:DUF1289 domain-containing protein [Denitratisoma sp. DHT3]|uniref:DUF1289 domain-containing protein n=1 Tax=Denitratisoma sp. DHT3 TaxID=1981880 RepID=UPI00119EB428|nr:DUF1289 domain-containing protein [Denitratisoma sp. DHT3]